MKTNFDKWGFIYFNPNDKRVIVPKINASFGWTFNFARPVTYVIIVAFIALLVFVTM